jgi:hypothetical protein
MTSRVVAVIEPVLATMGAELDPECWVVWGDDPALRYLILVPTDAGLLDVHVRVNVPMEGPRVSAKLVRWSRVQVGELAIDMASGHRLISFQVENQVLKGSDADAETIASFALGLFDAIDGRTVASVKRVGGRRASTRGAPADPVRATAPADESAGPKRAKAPQLPPPSES